MGLHAPVASTPALSLHVSRIMGWVATSFYHPLSWGGGRTGATGAFAPVLCKFWGRPCEEWLPKKIAN